MQILLLIFILVPIIEIAVFIQVGELIGLATTLIVVFLTAIIGVNLLKQQGLKAWQDIQQTMAQGQIPAIEMAAAAQLLFAGGLLLTPGFVTDIIGFALMVPAIRQAIALAMLKHWSNRSQKASSSHFYSHNQRDFGNGRSNHGEQGRTIEGEAERLDD